MFQKFFRLVQPPDLSCNNIDLIFGSRVCSFPTMTNGELLIVEGSVIGLLFTSFLSMLAVWFLQCYPIIRIVLAISTNLSELLSIFSVSYKDKSILQKLTLQHIAHNLYFNTLWKPIYIYNNNISLSY